MWWSDTFNNALWNFTQRHKEIWERVLFRPRMVRKMWCQHYGIDLHSVVHYGLIWDIILLKPRIVRKTWPIFVVSDVKIHLSIIQYTYILLFSRDTIMGYNLPRIVRAIFVVSDVIHHHQHHVCISSMGCNFAQT